MALLTRHRQQPSEMIRRQVDYSEWLASGEKLTAVEFVIEETRPAEADPDENPFMVVSPSFDAATEQKLTFFAGGSVDGSSVLLTIKITTSDTQNKEDEIEYLIDEVGASG